MSLKQKFADKRQLKVSDATVITWTKKVRTGRQIGEIVDGYAYVVYRGRRYFGRVQS